MTKVFESLPGSPAGDETQDLQLVEDRLIENLRRIGERV